MKTIRIASIAVFALALLASLGCSGGGGGGGNKSEGTYAFTIHAYATVGTQMQPLDSATVAGKFGTDKPSLTNRDWICTTDATGYHTVISTDFPILATKGASLPQDMGIFLKAHPKCQFGLDITTSATWTKNNQEFPVSCQGGPLATAAPSQIDVNSPPASITLTGENLATSYGVPRVEWYDEFGSVVATQYPVTYAADGTSLTINPPSNIGTLYSGNYAILVLPVQSDGTYWSQGAAGITLVGNDPPPSNPVPCGFATWEDYEAAQQCRPNEIWDDSMCTCRPLMID